MMLIIIMNDNEISCVDTFGCAPFLLILLLFSYFVGDVVIVV